MITTYEVTPTTTNRAIATIVPVESSRPVCGNVVCVVFVVGFVVWVVFVVCVVCVVVCVVGVDPPDKSKISSPNSD